MSHWHRTLVGGDARGLIDTDNDKKVIFGSDIFRCVLLLDVGFKENGGVVSKSLADGV